MCGQQSNHWLHTFIIHLLQVFWGYVHKVFPYQGSTTKIKVTVHGNSLLVCEVQLDTRELTAILAHTIFNVSNQFLNLDAEIYTLDQ